MIDFGKIYGRSTKLINGNPLHPQGSDLISITGLNSHNDDLPEGWRVLSTGTKQNFVGLLCHRHEIPVLTDGER